MVRGYLVMNIMIRHDTENSAAILDLEKQTEAFLPDSPEVQTISAMYRRVACARSRDVLVYDFTPVDQ
jgi:hypothetical protein